MSACEYNRLTIDGFVDDSNAAFAVINKDDNLSDCFPPPPTGSLMLWPESESIKMRYWDAFGPIRVSFQVPDDHVIYRGQGRYEIHRMDDNPQEEFFVNEVAVRLLLLDWVVEVDDYLLSPEKADPYYIPDCNNAEEPCSYCIRWICRTNPSFGDWTEWVN